MMALPFLLVSVIAASCLVSAASSLPALKAERWVNSVPLTAQTLQGKVVLIDFWEYTCVNWIRTAPCVKAWHRDYGPAVASAARIALLSGHDRGVGSRGVCLTSAVRTGPEVRIHGHVHSLVRLRCVEE